MTPIKLELTPEEKAQLEQIHVDNMRKFDLYVAKFRDDLERAEADFLREMDEHVSIARVQALEDQHDPKCNPR